LLTEDKLYLKQIHSSVRIGQYILLVALLLLSLFTRPPWCTNYGSLIDVRAAQQDQCEKGPDGLIFYKSDFPLFSADAMGRTATILMFLVTCDQFFIYMVLKGVKSENSSQRKFLAFLLLGLTLTHFLFDIMEQTKAITFRLSELSRCFFLMTSM